MVFWGEDVNLFSVSHIYPRIMAFIQQVVFYVDKWTLGSSRNMTTLRNSAGIKTKSCKFVGLEWIEVLASMGQDSVRRSRRGQRRDNRELNERTTCKCQVSAAALQQALSQNSDYYEKKHAKY